MDNTYEKFIFKLEEPNHNKWSKFKELQPEINEISQVENLKTRSVVFDNKTFKSNVEITVPSLEQLSSAAMNVCNLYLKYGLKHKLISRSAVQPIPHFVKVFLQYRLLNPSSSRWKDFTDLQNTFSSIAQIHNVNRYYDNLNKDWATSTSIYESKDEKNIIKMIHENTVLMSRYQLEGKFIEYHNVTNLDFSDAIFTKLDINIIDPWKASYNKIIRREYNRKYYYLKKGLEHPPLKKRITLEERIKRNNERSKQYYYLKKGLESPPPKKELTLKEKKENRKVYLKKYYIENREKISKQRKINRVNFSSGQKEKERELLRKKYLEKCKVLREYRKKDSKKLKKYQFKQVNEFNFSKKELKAEEVIIKIKSKMPSVFQEHSDRKG